MLRLRLLSAAAVQPVPQLRGHWRKPRRCVRRLRIAVPESAVYGVGEMSFAGAALVEPLACVVWGLQQVQLQAGDRMLIFGAGPMGLLMMQAVKRAGVGVCSDGGQRPLAAWSLPKS